MANSRTVLGPRQIVTHRTTQSLILIITKAWKTTQDWTEHRLREQKKGLYDVAKEEYIIRMNQKYADC